MKLDISSLEQATQSLNVAVDRSQEDLTDKEVRDAVIQRFGCTFRLSLKMIKRFIEVEVPEGHNVDQLNYKDLLRMALEVGLIDDSGPWIEYRSQRIVIPHTYNKNKSESVYKTAVIFLESSKELVVNLRKRISD